MSTKVNAKYSIDISAVPGNEIISIWHNVKHDIVRVQTNLGWYEWISKKKAWKSIEIDAQVKVLRYG